MTFSPRLTAMKARKPEIKIARLMTATTRWPDRSAAGEAISLLVITSINHSRCCSAGLRFASPHQASEERKGARGRVLANKLICANS